MPRNPLQTRLRILTAAGNLFSRHGFCATTLEDILTAAGITKGAFYHYFKSKEDVCTALLEEALESTRRLFLSLAESNPYEAFEQWISRIMDGSSQEGLAFRLVLRLSDEAAVFHGPVPDRFSLFWAEQAGGLEKILASFQSEQGLRLDLRSSALLLLSTAVGLIRLQNTVPAGLPTESLLKTALRLILS
ncbi:MAG: TetR/AcrR family transcriptional regulator [Anaerohalosphaeraceae bacterium]